MSKTAQRIHRRVRTPRQTNWETPEMRYVAEQPPKKTSDYWLIRDTKHKVWVVNAKGWIRRFKTEKAAKRAAKKLNEL